MIPKRLLHMPTEAEEHRILATYLDTLRYVWCHPPNGGRRDARTGRTLKSMGVKAGVPDFLIFSGPHGAILPCKGIAIELKRRKASPPTPQQKAWIAELSRLGWFACIARGADKAIEQLTKAEAY